MASLRSQTLDISAASVVLVSSVAAGLIGLLVGRFSTPQAGRRAAVPEVGRSESAPSGSRPEWQSIAEVEQKLRARDAELEGLRRNYELDTGLLKQEIRRLTDSLAELDTGWTTMSTEGPTSSSRRGFPGTPAGGQARPMEFSSLEDLVGGSLRGPDRP